MTGASGVPPVAGALAGTVNPRRQLFLTGQGDVVDEAAGAGAGAETEAASMDTSELGAVSFLDYSGSLVDLSETSSEAEEDPAAETESPTRWNRNRAGAAISQEPQSPVRNLIARSGEGSGEEGSGEDGSGEEGSGEEGSGGQGSGEEGSGAEGSSGAAAGSDEEVVADADLELTDPETRWRAAMTVARVAGSTPVTSPQRSGSAAAPAPAAAPTSGPGPSTSARVHPTLAPAHVNYLHPDYTVQSPGPIHGLSPPFVPDDDVDQTDNSDSNGDKDSNGENDSNGDKGDNSSSDDFIEEPSRAVRSAMWTAPIAHNAASATLRAIIHAWQGLPDTSYRMPFRYSA